jgi:hypothetical protein
LNLSKEKPPTKVYMVTGLKWEKLNGFKNIANVRGVL